MAQVIRNDAGTGRIFCKCYTQDRTSIEIEDNEKAT